MPEITKPKPTPNQQPPQPVTVTNGKWTCPYCHQSNRETTTTRTPTVTCRKCGRPSLVEED